MKTWHKKKASPPEAGGDVLNTGWCDAEHALVGTATVEPAQMTEIGPHLDVVEVPFVDGWRDCGPPCVPTDFQLWVFRTYIAGHRIDSLWLGVAPHQSNAGESHMPHIA